MRGGRYELAMPECRAPRTTADERWLAAQALQAATIPLMEYDTLEEMERDPEALQRYVDAVLRCGAGFRAPSEWIGPLCFVLDELDQEAFTERLLAYRKKLTELQSGR